MLTEIDEGRKAFEIQEQIRHVRDQAKINAQRNLIGRHKIEYLDSTAQARFERLLQSCEKDAHEIACEAGEEASRYGSRTEHRVAAYEVAYIEAYSDALPALVATALAREDVLDPVA